MTPEDGRRPDDAADEESPAALADRLRYAPAQVDPGRVLAVLSASDPAGRATVAAGISGTPTEHAGRVTEAVPLLADALDGDHDRGPGPFLAALARVAAADPSAVRPAAGRLVDHLDGDDPAGRAAERALQRVVAAAPAERDRVEPLLDHGDDRVRARAVSVLAAATASSPGAASGLLDTCARLVATTAAAREDAVTVLARAGWLDPAALDPAVDTLVSLVRNSDPAPTMRGGTDTATLGDAGGSAAGSEGADDRGRAGSTADPDDGDLEVCRTALVALGHVAGHDPVAVQSVVPVCVELATADHDGIRVAAARLLATIALQEPATAVSLRDFTGAASYFDRMAVLEALGTVSAGLPGRATLVLEFVADENAFIRHEVYRQVRPASATHDCNE